MSSENEIEVKEESKSGASTPTGNKCRSPKQQSETEEEPEKVFKKKRLVSYDVFMKHVKYLNGSVNVLDIFSKACFEEWIENRKGTPKEPEESFRKALVAHVSGKDDRKPFVPEIEFEILKRLRQSNPWPCFSDSINGSSKIGERGLKKSSLGFHEAKRKSAELRRPPNMVYPSPCQYLNYPPTQMPMPHMFPGYYPCPPQLYHQQNYMQRSPKRRLISAEAWNYENRQLKLTTTINFMLNQARSNTPSGMFAQVLAQFYTHLELRNLFSRINELFNPFIASRMNVINTPRTQRRFIVPELNTKFDSTKEIGEVILNIFGEVMSIDTIAEKYLDSKTNQNKNLFCTFFDSVERALAMSACLNSLMNIGSCFARWVLRKQGEGQVLLVHLGLGKDRVITCKFQDVTDKYPSLFNKADKVV